jgi:hypothetical protein
VAVTHVRNLLAAPALLAGGPRGHIPVSGGPRTGSLVWVEKNGKGWILRVDEAPEPVQAAGTPPSASQFLISPQLSVGAPYRSEMAPSRGRAREPEMRKG